MRFRAGLLVGFGAGYYFGTMAGRERYDQIQEMIGKVKRSDTYEEVSDKAKAVVDLGVERAKDLVDSTIETNGNTAPVADITEVYIEVPETDPPIRP